MENETNPIESRDQGVAGTEPETSQHSVTPAAALPDDDTPMYHNPDRPAPDEPDYQGFLADYVPPFSFLNNQFTIFN